MSIKNRKYLFNEVEVNGIKELDYLTPTFKQLDLRTIDKYKVTDVTQYRPDLISNIHYGSYHFGWLIAFHNNFFDPVGEFVTGKIVDIPSLEDYYRIFNIVSRRV